VRHTSLCSCVHVRVLQPVWIRAGEGVQRDVTANPNAVFQYSVSLLPRFTLVSVWSATQLRFPVRLSMGRWTNRCWWH
jgi:hypothetical protein